MSSVVPVATGAPQPFPHSDSSAPAGGAGLAKLGRDGGLVRRPVGWTVVEERILNALTTHHGDGCDVGEHDTNPFPYARALNRA